MPSTRSDGGPIRTTTAPTGPTLSRATPIQRRGVPLWVASEAIHGASAATRHALIALSNLPWSDLVALTQRGPQVLLAEFARRDAAEQALRDAQRWGVNAHLGTPVTSRTAPTAFALVGTLATAFAAATYDASAGILTAALGTALTAWTAFRARRRAQALDRAWDARRTAATRPLPEAWDATQRDRRASLDEADVERQARAWLDLDQRDALTAGPPEDTTRARGAAQAARDRLTAR